LWRFGVGAFSHEQEVYLASEVTRVNVILFGATGMVGQGVLRECLEDEGIERVFIIGRKPAAQKHPKVTELTLPDMYDVESARTTLAGFDACFYCLGVSAVGLSESEYSHLTFDLTISWAKALAHENPSLTFIYVSGAGTGRRQMWAQVKLRTENALLELFPNAYMFRLAALQPMNGEVSKTRWTRVSYSVLKPLLPLIRLVVPGSVITTEELGRAMIKTARFGAPKHVLENRDLIKLGQN